VRAIIRLQFKRVAVIEPSDSCNLPPNSAGGWQVDGPTIVGKQKGHIYSLQVSAEVQPAFSKSWWFTVAAPGRWIHCQSTAAILTM